MSKHSDSPQQVTERLWYYEEKGGLNIIYEIQVDGEYIRTDQITIPWRKILASVRRHGIGE